MNQESPKYLHDITHSCDKRPAEVCLACMQESYERAEREYKWKNSWDRPWVQPVYGPMSETTTWTTSDLGVDKMVNSPDHYTVGGLEAIDVLRAKLTPEEYRGYLKGNALKYLMRANYKGKHDQDIDKACWYMEELNYGEKKENT